jgi:xanthine/uracil permease
MSSSHMGGLQSPAGSGTESLVHNPDAMFDALPAARIPARDSVLMGLQNVFVMTGIFVFPGIMGKSFDLPTGTVADLYGATFIGCGLTTILIAGLFGRAPLVAGPYAGVFAALMSFGHMPAAVSELDSDRSASPR